MQYIFPERQAGFLRAMRAGSYRHVSHSSALPQQISLEGKMPPPHEQAMRGTCVATAVVSLLEYLDDCKTRLSVQFLDAATKKIEREGLEKCLALVRDGRDAPPAFEEAFRDKLLQLRLLAEVNGGFAADAMKPYVALFEKGVRSHFDPDAGSLLRSCFRAVSEYGVCRHAIWPYAAVPVDSAAVGEAAFAFPPGSIEDARKRRRAEGVYMLPSPNNVEEIRGLLSGANSRRPVPVCATVDYFEGCDRDGFAFPSVREDASGALVAENARKGVHCITIVGFTLDDSYAGGGFFTVRNSWGRDWGRNGCGPMPFAYLECFVREAGTILQDMVDYAGDGYGGMQAAGAASGAAAPRRRARRIAVQLLAAAGVVAAAVGLTLAFNPSPAAQTRAAAGEPQETRRLEPIPPDGAAPVDCCIRITGANRGEALKLVTRLLPDVVPETESDDWNDTVTLRVSRTRFKRLAVAIQAALRRNVYLADRGRTLEIEGIDGAREVGIQTAIPAKVREWMQSEDSIRAKILQESDYSMTLLTFERGKFVRALEKRFLVSREYGDILTVKEKPAGGRSADGGETERNEQQ